MSNDPALARRGSARITGAGEGPVLLDAEGVAEMLNRSARHVRRMADSGRMPRPIKLGALSRWSLTAVERWVADGCPRSNGKRRT